MIILAYRIDYQENQRRSIFNDIIIRIISTGMFFLLFLFIVTAFWPDGKEVLGLLMISDTTLDAAETFVSELNCGNNIKNAVSDFFETIKAYETIH